MSSIVGICEPCFPNTSCINCIIIQIPEDLFPLHHPKQRRILSCQTISMSSLHNVTEILYAKLVANNALLNGGLSCVTLKLKPPPSLCVSVIHLAIWTHYFISCCNPLHSSHRFHLNNKHRQYHSNPVNPLNGLAFLYRITFFPSFGTYSGFLL